jgi:hypothetical protein
MAQEIINNGTFVGDPSAEIIYNSFEKAKNNFSELYSITGWESRSDIVSVVSLTASIDNVVTLTGASESNGGLTFFDANAKIIPISLNDVIHIDFACTFVSVVATAGQSVEIYLKAGSARYRGYTHVLLKGAGIDDFFSISWCVPCGADIVANGLEIVLKPSSTMNCKERYLVVNRTHKGI